jgi:tRNA(fMet)-specific endonuclease VapC
MALFTFDTDMLSLYRAGHPVVGARVRQHERDAISVTIITVEEQLNGWYGLLRRVKGRDQLAMVYDELAATVKFVGGLPILPFSVPAIARYDALAKLKLNVGKMDLRIAAIALERSAVVVTRNTRDFSRVPGLTIEDWTV